MKRASLTRARSVSRVVTTASRIFPGLNRDVEYVVTRLGVSEFSREPVGSFVLRFRRLRTCSSTRRIEYEFKITKEIRDVHFGRAFESDACLRHSLKRMKDSSAEYGVRGWFADFLGKKERYWPIDDKRDTRGFLDKDLTMIGQIG